MENSDHKLCLATGDKRAYPDSFFHNEVMIANIHEQLAFVQAELNRL